MALRDWIPRRWRPVPGPGRTPIHVGDPRYDAWEVVRDFGEVRTARAWHQALAEAGIEAALTADWPLMEWNEEEKRWDALHHPFTAPAGEFDPDDPGAARAQAYDVVWNGQELGGGSIRINRADVQQAVFAALGIDAETAEARFGFLLEALRFGAPPHGGIAYGVDRIVQRLYGAETIRDVIAFPKTASGFDLLTGAPAPVDDLQLRELNIGIHKPKLPGH